MIAVSIAVAVVNANKAPSEYRHGCGVASQLTASSWRLICQPARRNPTTGAATPAANSNKNPRHSVTGGSIFHDKGYANMHVHVSATTRRASHQRRPITVQAAAVATCPKVKPKNTNGTTCGPRPGTAASATSATRVAPIANASNTPCAARTAFIRPGVVGANEVGSMDTCGFRRVLGARKRRIGSLWRRGRRRHNEEPLIARAV